MKQASDWSWQLIAAGSALLLMVLFCFQACSGRIQSNADFGTLSARLMQSLDAAVYPQQDNVKIRRYLGLDPSSFQNIAFYRTDDAMSAGELLLVQFDTDEQREAFEQAAESRKSAQYDIYSGYAPEQAAMMEEAVVDAQGNFGLYYAGNDPQAVDQTFLSLLREGVQP